MSEKPIEKKSDTTGAESPTTARELDFDDDNENPPPPPKDPVAPSKTQKPMSAQAQAEATLIEAFPSVDPKVVKAVLTASRGQVEPAFNALLGMSDPNFKEEEPAAPPQPPRPTAAQRQLEEDERYARQLAGHYQTQAPGYGAYGSRTRGDPALPAQRQQGNLKPNEMYDDREHNFFDDDLPVIKDNIRKGFLETQKTVNSWLTNFKKTIDGDDEDYEGRPSAANQRQNYGPSQSDQLRGIRENARARQSGDHNRYDADPQILSDDFTTLRMQDNEVPPQQPPRPGRPLANPDLFKATPTAPQTGPVDEVDALYRQPTPTRQPSPGAGKTKKWQPLTSVAPNPEADDHDPFSLGDSDDEDAKSKDVKAEDSERLKKAAADAPTPAGSKPVAAEQTGQKDKEAVELLTKETKS